MYSTKNLKLTFLLFPPAISPLSTFNSTNESIHGRWKIARVLPYASYVIEYIRFLNRNNNLCNRWNLTSGQTLLASSSPPPLAPRIRIPHHANQICSRFSDFLRFHATCQRIPFIIPHPCTSYSFVSLLAQP